MTGTNKTEKIRVSVFISMAALILLIALLADYIVPNDPYQQNLSLSLLPPSRQFFLGTDRYGRCVFSRVLAGAKITVFSALGLVMGIAVFGTVIGILCGYKGGLIDSIVMRISDLFLAFPGMVFAIAAAGVMGGGLTTAGIALALISWPKYARLARSQVLSIKHYSYIEAAKMSGAGEWKLILKHILPAIAGTIIVTAALDIGVVIMELSGLTYLGFGANPPVPEWGAMMSSGRSMLQTAPWTIFAPGAAIFITVVVFNLLGDAVRDLLNPKH